MVPASTTTSNKARIKEFLATSIPDATFQDDQDIFASGHVNSLFVMQLVLFVEREFEIALASEDLDVDNFKTINAMVDLIEHKKPAE